MVSKLLIFSFLSNTFIPALSSSIVKFGSKDKEVPCNTKISWYKEINENTKRLYNEYYAKLAEAKLKPDDLDLLNSGHKKLENTVSAVFQRYDVDYDKFDSDINNTSAKEALCEKDIDWYQNMNLNLTRLTTDIGKKLLKILDHSESPFAQKKIINDFFGKLNNVLLTVIKPKNQFKEPHILKKEWELDQTSTAKSLHEVFPNKETDDYDDKLFRINEYPKITATSIRKRQKPEDETLPSVALTITCLIYICLVIVLGQVLARLLDRSYLRNRLF